MRVDHAAPIVFSISNYVACFWLVCDLFDVVPYKVLNMYNAFAVYVECYCGCFASGDDETFVLC